jgi:PilZ domain
MELIANVLTDPTFAGLDTDWVFQLGEVRAPERRREPRFPTNRLTMIYSTGPGGPERNYCSILDVSQHGMRVRTARPLTPGTQVRVTLRENSTVGTVCYCNPVSKNGFDHGILVEELRRARASS